MRHVIYNLLLSVLFLIGICVSSFSASADDEYDRLDGDGSSGKTVQVIEGAGNLEIHVSPLGSLKGLALKLDKKNQNKLVLVIGYRFDNSPRSYLVRRAILGISLQEDFKAFRDPTEMEFDKIIISNHGLPHQMVAFALDSFPMQDDSTQYFPDLQRSLAHNPKNPSSLRKSDDLPDPQDENSNSESVESHAQWLDW